MQTNCNRMLRPCDERQRAAGREAGIPVDRCAVGGLGLKSRLVRFGTAATLAAVMVAPLSAAEPVPETSGWGGFVLAGVGFASLRNNFVAGNGLVSIGSRTFDSLGARPSTDDTFLPVITGEVNYTFGGGWQAFFGTSLEDAVTLDGVTQLGLRKDLGAEGVLQAGFLFSGIPTETWEDPYAEGVLREKTDRDSKGIRLQWTRIMGSGFDLTLSYRDIEIDTERSVQGLTSIFCDAACQGLLVRDGEQYSVDVSYLFRLGPNRNHLVRPRVRYTADQRDGDALAGDAYWLQLTHAYLQPQYSVVSNVAYGQVSRDERNPVFGLKTDADRLVVDTTLFFNLPALGAGWQAVGSLLWGRDSSDVDFHNTDLLIVSVGMLHRFGTR